MNLTSYSINILVSIAYIWWAKQTLSWLVQTQLLVKRLSTPGLVYQAFMRHLFWLLMLLFWSWPRPLPEPSLQAWQNLRSGRQQHPYVCVPGSLQLPCQYCSFWEGEQRRVTMTEVILEMTIPYRPICVSEGAVNQSLFIVILATCGHLVRVDLVVD